MKTFEEACRAIFMADRKLEPDKLAVPRLRDNQEKRMDLLSQIVSSHEVHMLIMLFYDMHFKEGTEVEILISNAFAQGVFVGMEMERQETFDSIQSKGI